VGKMVEENYEGPCNEWRKGTKPQCVKPGERKGEGCLKGGEWIHLCKHLIGERLLERLTA